MGSILCERFIRKHMNKFEETYDKAMAFADDGEYHQSLLMIDQLGNLVETRQHAGSFIEALLYCMEDFHELHKLSVVALLDQMYVQFHSPDLDKMTEESPNFWRNFCNILYDGLDLG